MEFTLSINMDNAAFTDQPSGSEVARILRALADRLEEEELQSDNAYPLRDANGNRVGQAEVIG